MPDCIRYVNEAQLEPIPCHLWVLEVPLQQIRESCDFNDVFRYDGDSHSLQLVGNHMFFKKCVSVLILDEKASGGIAREGKE